LSLESADIIIANHALLFSDLVLREQNFSLLPDYKSIVIDEAHNIESVAQEHFGIDLSNHRVSYLIDRLYNPRTKRGFLVFRKDVDQVIDAVESVRKASRKFFKSAEDFYKKNYDQTAGRCYKNFTEDNLSGHLKILRKHIIVLANKTDNTDDKFETNRFANMAAELIMDLENFISQKKPDQVYWIELTQGRSKTVRLKSAPLNVAEDVKRTLFDVYDSVILTSATLSCSGHNEKSGFNFFAGRVGLEKFEALELGSPFDYKKQVSVYLEKDMPDPNSKEFVKTAAEKIKKYVAQTFGRAFVLFTSYQMLNAVAELTAEWFAENDINLLVQAGRYDRETLLKKFKSDGNNVLFGTDSFWQGVDVPGEALSNVIITKLPFAVPNHPLTAARLEQIKQKGGNPFFDYQLPSAIIKFKQGIGRLIRKKTDKGIIVVLDSRIVTKKYGQNFLAVIPPSNEEIVSDRM
jgi:ATP-dependent DNA helicase DinG